MRAAQDELQPTRLLSPQAWIDLADVVSPASTAAAEAQRFAQQHPPAPLPAEEPESLAPSAPLWRHGWPVPSTILPHPDEARACIHLPEFDPQTLALAQVIADRFPFAEAEYRNQRNRSAEMSDPDMPHFEKVFRIATSLARVQIAWDTPDYDELLILTAWHCVRPQEAGYLGSYPKSLLCPLSHSATPAALESLSAERRSVFDRRVPHYLRYLLCARFGLHTCADLENADLRQLLKSAGFRLIRASAVPEIVFAGITRGDDPPVRPWKLTLRQELSDGRAAEMLVQAALWLIQYGSRMVRLEPTGPRWNIGLFERTDWETAFLSLGVRISSQFTRQSGLLDWRAVLARCLEIIGPGNLPPEIVAQVCATPQRVSHDSHEAIWEVLDRTARAVLDQARETEPGLFSGPDALNYETARKFRRWARLFDACSPNILSRFGVSAFTALHRVAPRYFGWGATQLKPWELEQEHGKWKGPRGRALLRSAYAYALFEAGIGQLEEREDQVLWQCTSRQFTQWCNQREDDRVSAYDFLYHLASRHGLTPLLERQVSHTAAISLLAGLDLHSNLPRIEGCWDVCLRAAIEHHGGKLEVRLVVPDLVPLPLRLRKAVLAPLDYGYLHKEIRLVRTFDLRMAQECRRRLEELPGWWEDERIVGTPLLDRVQNPDDPARIVLRALRPEPWIELDGRRIRLRALSLLLSKRATTRTEPGRTGLSSEELRILLRLAMETMEHSNIAHVSLPAIRSGFERLLAREDTCQMLDSLLLHFGTAYETEVWGQVRKLVVLDVISDLVGLVLRNSLLHLMSAE